MSLTRMCGSSQQAVHFAAQAVAAGDMNYVIGCGVESMTRAPMFLDIGLGRNVSGFEVLNPELFQRHELIHQGESAERSARNGAYRGRCSTISPRKATAAPRRRRKPGSNKELLPVQGISP